MGEVGGDLGKSWKRRVFSFYQRRVSVRASSVNVEGEVIPSCSWECGNQRLWLTRQSQM